MLNLLHKLRLFLVLFCTTSSPPFKYLYKHCKNIYTFLITFSMSFFLSFIVFSIMDMTNSNLFLTVNIGCCRSIISLLFSLDGDPKSDMLIDSGLLCQISLRVIWLIEGRLLCWLKKGNNCNLHATRCRSSVSFFFFFFYCEEGKLYDIGPPSY